MDIISFLGDWKAPMMKNPAYKGKWVHPEIDNPDYAADSEIYAYDDFGRIGLDLWQVTISLKSSPDCIFVLGQIWNYFLEFLDDR